MTTEDLQALVSGGAEVIPPGVYQLTKPIRVGVSGVMDARARGLVEFQPAPNVYLPALSLTLGQSRETTTPWLGQGGGWLNLRDVWQPSFPTTAFYFDATYSLDAFVPDVAYSLADSESTLDDVNGDTPFQAYFVGSQLVVKLGAFRWDSSTGFVKLGLQRLTIQQTAPGRIHLWYAANGNQQPALVIDTAAPSPLAWPLHCDLTMGSHPFRAMEGSPKLAFHPHCTVHRVGAYNGPYYSPAVPPAGFYVPPLPFGVWSDLSTFDGCLVKCKAGGVDSWLIWRAGTGDGSMGRASHVSNISFNGMGRCGAGLYSSLGHGNVFDNLGTQACRHGLILQGQCYKSVIRNHYARGNHFGLTLANNSGLVNIEGPQWEGGNGYGLLAADSDGVCIVGGWAANNTFANILVKGDNCDLHAVGFNSGFEGTVGKCNVRVVNGSSATFTGGTYLMGSSPIPLFEFVRSSGGVFLGSRFGPIPGLAGCILHTSHDPNRLPSVAEGRRWAPQGNDPASRQTRDAVNAVPVFDPASTLAAVA